MIYRFNPTPSAIHWRWATLSGPDALDFLHRVTTVNTNALQVGHGTDGCFLTAQGKLRAFFTLWNYGENEYGFEWDAGVSDHWKKALFEAIDQYTFAEKMTLTDVTGLESRWIFADSESNAELSKLLGISSADQTLAVDEEIRICHHGDRVFGKSWITVWGRPQRLEQWMDRQFSQARAISFEELEGWRIDAGSPWIDHELTDATVPLEAGLVHAIAQNKGCYPGQEVIEKIVSLGSPARRLALIEGAGTAPAPGAKMLNTTEPAVEIGQITSVHALRTDGGQPSFRALGYVRKIHAKEGFKIRIEGSSAEGSLIRIAPYA